MKKTEKIFNVQTGEETIIERDETPSEKLIRENAENETNEQRKISHITL